MHCEHPRKPESTNAYVVGGGIASLATATHLIHDARVPPSQIHILESGSQLGGYMKNTRTPEAGYILRGRQMLNFSYKCLCNLLSINPLLTNLTKTII
jgi:oleate hydratase